MKIMQNRSIITKINILFTGSILIIFVAMLIFYVQAFNSAKNEKQKYIENIAKNLAQNTNDIASSIMLTAEALSDSSFTRTLLMNKNSSANIESYQTLKRLVNRLVKNSPHIRTILFLNNEGTLYNFNLYEHAFVSKLDKAYDILSMEVSEESFSGAFTLENTEESYYVYSQPIYDDYINVNSREQIGVCVVICSDDSLNKSCENAHVSEETYLAILDRDNQILACNLVDEDGAVFEAKGAFCWSYPISQTGWKIFVSVPYREFYDDLQQIHYIAILFVLVLLGTFLLLLFQIRRSLVEPLDKTVKFLMQPPYQLLHERLNEEGDNEMLILSVNINQMLDKICDLNHTVLQNQARLYEIELLKSQAQLEALQYQINPHFLYNTLNCIQGLACQNKYQEICSVVGDLSFVLRYSIQEGNISTVEHEFQCVRKYLNIIDIRFSRRFRFELLMDEIIADYEMPRFLLQPLVENAISHGLKERPHGSLTLSATCDRASILHIECKDDGVGIAPERLLLLRQALATASTNQRNQNDSEFGIGLINVQRRIKLLYGEVYGLSIDSTLGNGTTICADFPVEPKK